MTRTIRLTMAQALMRHLAALRVELDDGTLKFTGNYTPLGSPSGMVFLS